MTDVLIIGSGPAGMTAAIYAKRANLNVLIVEKEYEGTGQMAESSRIDNYPGFYGINGYELGEKIREHAEALGIKFLEAEVTGIQKTEESFDITLEGGEVQSSKTVIYTAGAAHRKLAVPGSEKFENRGISYCASCDGAFYHGKDVAVIGGGNTALQDAEFLSNYCNKVYVVHRRDEFRGESNLVDVLKEKDNVEFVLDSIVKDIEGKFMVERLFLRNKKTGEDFHIPVSGVFVAIGQIPQNEIFDGLVRLDENGFILASEDCMTSHPGIFAAGDCRTKEVRQLTTAAADGSVAALAACKYLSMNF